MKRRRPSGQICLQKETTARGNARVGSVASNNVSAGISRRCDNPFKQISDSTAVMAASRCTPGVWGRFRLRAK